MCIAPTTQPVAFGAMDDIEPCGVLGVQHGSSEAVCEKGTGASSRPTMKSPFRGLSWDRKNNGWRVRLYYAGKQRHVGRFEDDVTAAKAYDKAAYYLYGANAITNFGLEAVHNDPTEVSTFIVLAKEQAEQEQLARQQQRQQYSLQHMGMHAGPTSYALPQQAFLLPQQQHASMACAIAAGSNSMPMAVPAWPNAAGAGSPACAYALAPQCVMPGLSNMVGAQGQHVGFSTPQQQQMQAWVPAGTCAMMQQQKAGMQVSGQVVPAGTYISMQVDPSTAAVAQYPANGYVLGTQQGMHVLASPSASVAASTAMLASPQQSQAQQQQFILQAISMPAQQAGLAAVPMSAVSNTPAAAQLGIAGPTHELSLLQQASGQLAGPVAAGESSPSACSIGGHAFVQDMLSSLSHAGQAVSTAPAGLQQQGVLVPPAVSWALCEATSSAVAAGGAWAMGQVPLASAPGLISASPAYSATSSTSANTSTGFVLPVPMCPVSSPGCA